VKKLKKNSAPMLKTDKNVKSWQNQLT